MNAQTHDKIELIQADSVHYDEDQGKYIQRLMGNVKLKQGTAIMSCEEAHLNSEANTFEAFRNVHIFQADTINIHGDHLFYDGNTKIAVIDGNVVMIDDDMRLTTRAITYNTASRVGYYTSGGVLTSGNDKLTSRVGTYNGYSKRVGFRDNVVLVNPEYTMKSDTLIYSTTRKIAWFYGPTEITSEEDQIFCKYGWYDTRRKLAAFSKGAKIVTGPNTISGDSIEYDRNRGMGTGYGNLEVTDSIEEIKIYGSYGWSNQKTKETLVTGNPWAKKQMDEDSFYLKADTFYYVTDTSTGKLLSAYRSARVFKQDIQAVCDSLTYSVADSNMKLFYSPVLWTDENQITGEHMVIKIRENKIDMLEVEGKAFVLSKEGDDKYNQISGKRMDTYFRDGEVHHIKVIGNGLSVYYAAQDSVSYTGVNKIECSEMLIRLDSGNVNEILFYNKPVGVFYPIDQFPDNLKRLRGFKLYDGIRPKLIEFED